MKINKDTTRALRIVQMGDLMVKLIKQFYATRKK